MKKILFSLNDPATDAVIALPTETAATIAQAVAPSNTIATELSNKPTPHSYLVTKTTLVRGGRLVAELEAVEGRAKRTLMLEIADVQMLVALGKPVPTTGSTVIAESSYNPQINEVNPTWVKLVM